MVGHAAAVDEAIAVIREVTPDLVFLDVNLGDGGNGADVIKGTREVQPAPKFLALTSLESFESVSRLFIAGVDGYITKGTQCDQIIESALQVLAGERPVSRGIADHMLSIDEAAARRRKVDALTDEEREIVRLIARGYAYREVRKKLELERQEFKDVVKRIFDKLETASLIALTELMYDTDHELSDDDKPEAEVPPTDG